MTKSVKEVFAGCLTPAEVSEMEGTLINVVRRNASARRDALRSAYSAMPPTQVVIGVNCEKCIKEELARSTRARAAAKKARQRARRKVVR